MNPIIKKYGKGRPVVALVGSLHGDEPVGARVLDEIGNLQLIKGQIITVIGNPLALKKRVRFIEEDLNRSFLKEPINTRERKIAKKIMKEISSADFVIDIHSTTTNTNGVVIVSSLNKKIKEAIDVMKPKNVVLISSMAKYSLIGSVSHSVSLEYGEHHKEKTYRESLEAVLRFLSYQGIIERKRAKKSEEKINYFKVSGAVKRPNDFKMNPIKNLSLVRKGSILGYVASQPIKAKESFYPFLFGPKSYPDIMGFKAKKIQP